MAIEPLDRRRAALEAEYFAREDAAKLAALRDRRRMPARSREPTSDDDAETMADRLRRKSTEARRTRHETE